MTDSEAPADDSVAGQLRAVLAERYRVENMIGRGGMATVYGAWDLKHDRRVAIKVLSPDLASALGAERFIREIKTAARLSHPNILAVFDSGSIGELLYYVMPFVAGESLRDKLDREKQLPIDNAIEITCDVASALGYAHSNSVIHRDVKPENILLQDGHVLVADFGIARGEERTDERLTGTGMSLGTAAYMAPEQAAGEKVDGRSDIYALGCTLYEMLAGNPPFTGANAMALMARHTLEPVPSIRIVRSSVPEELEDAIMVAMAKVPADRFQTMEEFKMAVLGEVPAKKTSSTPRYTPRYTAKYRIPEGKPARTTKRRIAEIVIGALVVAGAAFGGRELVNRKKVVVRTDASRVAVLYFDELGSGALRYLADGLTESLIDRLSTVPALDVISKDGVRPFRGQSIPSDSVGRTLQVGSIVRGSVEPNGSKVRVTVRLVDALSDADISRKSFEMDTSQAVAAQTQLATEVVEFLRERLGDEVRLREDRKETGSSQAWTLVERAEKLRKDADSLSAGGTIEYPAALAMLARGDSLLASAEQLDPQWAKIPARRAGIMYLRAKQLAKQPPLAIAALEAGVSQADRALSLQPNSADALEIKGQLQLLRFAQRVDADPVQIDRLLPAAESSLTKAVELNKDQAGAWASLSSLYYAKPDIQAANAAALAAYRADAYLASAKSILKRLFWTSHDLEQFPEALKWCTEGNRRFPSDPEFTSCRLWMYTTRLARPDIDSVWIYKRKYVELSPAPSRVTAAKLGDILAAGALSRAGLADSARHVLLRARATPLEDPTRELEGDEAVIRVMLGDHDEAIRLLSDYLTANPGHRKGFATRTGWWWRDLQGNPKFKQLLAGAR